MDILINRKEMIELENYHFATPFELMDLDIKHQTLLSLQKVRQPDITWLLIKEQINT